MTLNILETVVKKQLSFQFVLINVVIQDGLHLVYLRKNVIVILVGVLLSVVILLVVEV